MILAAGLGTRMRPLSDLRAKPALPVLGRPVVAWLLAWLRSHGVREVAINLHHLPETIVEAVERAGPPDVQVSWLREASPLGTGGGMRGARAFLEQSDPSVVLAGDMLLDVDLGALVAAHRASGADCTLLLRRDPRQAQFGTVGIDPDGAVRRIARRFDLGGETDAGVFVGLRLLSPRAFARLPEAPQGEAFEDLSDWLAPALARGELRVRGHLVEPTECVWEPVGTPAEYLRVNLQPPRVSFFSPTQMVASGTNLVGRDADVVLGRDARVASGARLRRVVVWEEEHVPAGIRATGGVFGGGTFYACETPPRSSPAGRLDEEPEDE